MDKQQKQHTGYHKFHIYAVLLSCAILLGLGGFIRHLYRQLVEESRTVAWEITEKAADAMAMRLEDIRSDLQVFASLLSAGNKTEEDIKQLVTGQLKQKTFFRIHIAAADGSFLTSEYDMTEEYKESLKSLCPEDSVFSVNYMGNSGHWQTAIAVSGIVNGNPCRIYAECILNDLYLEQFMEFYDGQGYCYVISRKTGDFIMLPKNRFGQGLYSGLFTMLEAYEKNRPETLQRIYDALKSDTACTVRLEFRGEPSYFCFVPVEQQKDWFVVSVIPARVLQKNGMAAIGTVIFLGAALAAGACCILAMSLRRWKLRYEMEAIKMADRAKTSFLSSMSHEIRTPMNAIIGMTEIMRHNLSDCERMKACIDKIQTSSQFLLALINDVLDMSKIEGGKMPLEKEIFQIGPLLDAVLDLILPLARQHGHDFEACVFWEGPECLIGDKTRISQVLVNLLSNAVKYTPDGGRIRLRVYGRAERERNDCVRLRLEVEDNGIGMSREYQKLIFEPFSQEKNSLSRGTGLGMAIASQLIKLMDGEITLNSELNKGSLFSVTLCLSSVTEAACENRGREALQILAVELDPELCMSMETTFLFAGMELLSADSPAAALKALGSGRKFHILLLDSGLAAEADELAGTAKEMGVDVYLTGYGLDTAEETIKIPVKGNINKPVLPSRLIQARHIKRDLNSNHTAPLPLEGLHILMAEDNELNAEIAIELLGYSGAEVVRARNGLDAVRLFHESSQGEYDLILMDIQMPEMNGYDAAKNIRAQNRADAGVIPILAMTADVFSDDVLHSRESGMNGHVGKPIDMQKLIQEIQRVTGKETIR